MGRSARKRISYGKSVAALLLLSFRETNTIVLCQQSCLLQTQLEAID